MVHELSPSSEDTSRPARELTHVRDESVSVSVAGPHTEASKPPVELRRTLSVREPSGASNSPHSVGPSESVCPAMSTVDSASMTRSVGRMLGTTSSHTVAPTTAAAAITRAMSAVRCSRHQVTG
ncbi:hypothetical protein ASF63_12945 [Microbacterium sp. Leaf320]|nr:hypothetical protein ASF63_12945 [Microbacterium sp. Leaf320]